MSESSPDGALKADLTTLDELVNLEAAGPGLAGRVGVGRSAVVVTHDKLGPFAGCLAYELSGRGG